MLQFFSLNYFGQTSRDQLTPTCWTKCRFRLFTSMNALAEQEPVEPQT